MMLGSPIAVPTRRVLAIAGGLVLVTGLSANAELWRSPLHDLTYVQVEKRILAETYDPPDGGVPPTSAEVEPLPQEILRPAAPPRPPW